jgi:hypothetical protein
MFYLLCFLLLDETFDNEISFNQELSEIFGYLLNDTSAADGNNEIRIARLTSSLMEFINCDLSEYTDELSAKNKSINKVNQKHDESLEEDEFEPLVVNGIYHRIVYLTSFFNSSQSLDKLTVKLAFSCLKSIFQLFTVENELPQLDETNVNGGLFCLDIVFRMDFNAFFLFKLDFLFELIEKYGSKLFNQSSYTMFNIIEFLSIILAKDICNLPDRKIKSVG